jgi:putative nucleotidyltransferase with HDIG domain
VHRRRMPPLISRSSDDSGIVDLVRGVERWDPHTAAHMWTVANIAGHVGLQMGLPTQKLGTLFVGALLHDVGKIAIPNSVLNKPESLTPEEHALMRLHPSIGVKILERFGVPSPILLMVNHHHERFDGKGYPEGLRGDEIPLGARVIVAADALEAMTGGRPYRCKVPWEEALEEIVSNVGTQFDPEVVRALLRLEEEVHKADILKGVPATSSATSSLASLTSMTPCR